MKSLREHWPLNKGRKESVPSLTDEDSQMPADLDFVRTAEDLNAVLLKLPVSQTESEAKKQPWWKKRQTQWIGVTALSGALLSTFTGLASANFGADRTHTYDTKAYAAAAGSCLASPGMMRVPLSAQDLENLIDLRHDVGEQGIDIEASCVDDKFVRTIEVYNPDLSYDSEHKRFLMNGHRVLASARVTIPDRLQ